MIFVGITSHIAYNWNKCPCCSSCNISLVNKVLWWNSVATQNEYVRLDYHPLLQLICLCVIFILIWLKCSVLNKMHHGTNVQLFASLQKSMMD